MLSVDGLFLEIGDSLIIEDQDRLRALLDYVFAPKSPWVPPSRNNGRTTAHRERYCLRYYLKTEAANFAYPIVVEKTERPDFLITEATGQRIGVEHTDAGPEAFQRWLARADSKDDVSFLPNRDGKGAAEGFSDDEACQWAAEDIVAALTHKMTTINKYGYQDADRYVLVVYLLSNAPLFYDGDIDEIVSRLPDFQSVVKNATPENGGTKVFERALIIANHASRYWG